MGRKQHYDSIDDLLNDLDNESVIGGETDPLEDDDLELLHLINPDQQKPPKPPGPTQKKRGRKPKRKA